ncbi:extracellular solute-binding protein [Paenibacillus sp. J5C_2022]|uniref:extracellular solute-binding protein n=1 Tax=Paenibacillus sp. J5C2022 TaxID=2977129 RepID=UPI0021CE6BF6|nr:extracellular solute-binding protein [Paenibacillus sp. J5C2022]MCU6708384.1 extracellular solute-binding protein [Paenibacillus sp. J5C2022]
MKPKRTTSRHRLENMIQTLRSEIEIGTYPKGSFLPSELELYQQFGLSKNTVRKGLEVLVDEGLIEKIPRIGAQVLGKRRKSGAVTLRFGYYPSLVDETNLLQLVEQFNALHDDIHVQSIPVAWPRKQGMLEQYLKDDIFDVLTVNLYNYEFMRDDDGTSKLLEPFERLEDAYEFLNEPFSSGKKQYVLPFVFTPVILCYNKDHFREMNVPEPHSGWTWDDLCKAGSRLSQDKDRVGFHFHLMSENRWPIFLLQNDVHLQRDDQGQLQLEDDNMKQAIKSCMSIVNDQFPSYLSQSDSDAMNLFVNGKVSIIMATYSYLNKLKSVNFEYDIAPLPQLKQSRTMLVVIGLAMSKRSGEKPAARKFMDFLLSYESQLYIRRHTLSLPSHKRAAEWTGEEIVQRPHRFHMYREIVHTFRLYSDLGMSANELNALGSELRYYWSKLEELDTVLQRFKQSL